MRGWKARLAGKSRHLVDGRDDIVGLKMLVDAALLEAFLEGHQGGEHLYAWKGVLRVEHIVDAE